ncbi:hypothetical protein AB0L35_04400 [Streptomyces sp. NPDC052309]|uniref:hypothetical protein n=1 Tax=Streptomyces sp. NPDC052309 TaxID=3155421 RepID=UPI00343895C0
MSGLGELDRPATPNSPGAWDERSRECLDTGDPGAATPFDAPDGDGHPGPTTADGGLAVDELAADGRAVDGLADGGLAVDGDAGAAPGGATAGATAGARVGVRSPGDAITGGQLAPAARRVAGDPVKALMHRHRELCERAVDPLEIAAGLEAHGITDRTAARFRHRDVFSLAEEMHARIPRDGDTAPRPPAPATPPGRTAWIVLTLLPGMLCAAAVAGLRLTDGRPRLVAAVLGTLAVTLALRAALRRGPLSAAAHTGGFRTCWLVGYALLGDGLLRAALTGGPDGLPDGTADGPWPLTAAPVLALALACAPAAWSAHLFAAGARRKLAASRGLTDFSASVRPLLFGTFALFLGALAVLLAVTGAALDEPAAYPQALTLGALLLLARLLAVHGFGHAPTLLLTATAAAEATAVATVFAGRLPGCDLLAVPVETLVTTWGPAAVPTTACGIGALVLLFHAARRLTTASAHAPTETPA